MIRDGLMREISFLSGTDRQVRPQLPVRVKRTMPCCFLLRDSTPSVAQMHNKAEMTGREMPLIFAHCSAAEFD